MPNITLLIEDRVSLSSCVSTCVKIAFHTDSRYSWLDFLH